jgi:hypothetical protein
MTLRRSSEVVLAGDHGQLLAGDQDELGRRAQPSACRTIACRISGLAGPEVKHLGERSCWLTKTPGTPGRGPGG